MTKYISSWRDISRHDEIYLVMTKYISAMRQWYISSWQNIFRIYLSKTKIWFCWDISRHDEKTIIFYHNNIYYYDRKHRQKTIIFRHFEWRQLKMLKTNCKGLSLQLRVRFPIVVTLLLLSILYTGYFVLLRYISSWRDISQHDEIYLSKASLPRYISSSQDISRHDEIYLVMTKYISSLRDIRYLTQRPIRGFVIIG